MTDRNLPPTPPVAGQATVKKGPNCWVTGCGGCFVLLLVLIGFGWFVGWQVKRSALVEPFAPMEFSEAEKARMDARHQSLEEQQELAEAAGENWIPEEGLVLTEQEVNYWMTREDPETEKSLRLDFEPDEISAEMRLGEPGAEQRFKITARVTVVKTEQGMDIRLADVKLGSVSLPKAFLSEFQKENLAREILEDPDVQEELDQSIGGVEVGKDEIRLLPPEE